MKDDAYRLTNEIIQKLRSDMVNHYTMLSPKYKDGAYTIPVKDGRSTKMLEVTVKVKADS